MKLTQVTISGFGHLDGSHKTIYGGSSNKVMAVYFSEYQLQRVQGDPKRVAEGWLGALSREQTCYIDNVVHKVYVRRGFVLPEHIAQGGMSHGSYPPVPINNPGDWDD